VQFAEDKPEEVLERATREDTGGKEWKYYFSLDEPAEPVKREIEASLG
jgi:hypothetical protein